MGVQGSCRCCGKVTVLKPWNNWLCSECELERTEAIKEGRLWRRVKKENRNRGPEIGNALEGQDEN